MSRSVTYSVVPRKNPRDKDASPKFYAQAQARGDVNIREMSDRIQASCTVHKSDVYAVLVALEDVVAEAIQTILRREAYPSPYEALKALTRTGKPIDEPTIKDFIEGLDVSEAVKAELRAITPYNYIGI